MTCDTFDLLTARYRAQKVSRLIDFSSKRPACHAGGRVFEPRRSRHDFKHLALGIEPQKSEF